MAPGQDSGLHDPAGWSGSATPSGSPRPT